MTAARFTIAVTDPRRGARNARHALAEALARWGIDRETRDAVELLATEVVTNALRHGIARDHDDHQAVVLRALRHPDWIRVEVDDPDPTPPIRHRGHELDEHGRGLVILDRLAKEWGVTARPGGKTVWFHCPAQGHAD